ncbi:unnamed protein product [Moneuplotes crassus]|uniref:Uncharacterized protein n=1 Tax=Euplotes crassus TaxID=5936 RepID=A0AAD1U9Q9_EUPCR|nr:unnamed protein product [Moneuplotes crassus]
MRSVETSADFPELEEESKVSERNSLSPIIFPNKMQRFPQREPFEHKQPKIYQKRNVVYYIPRLQEKVNLSLEIGQNYYEKYDKETSNISNLDLKSDFRIRYPDKVGPKPSTFRSEYNFSSKKIELHGFKDKMKIAPQNITIKKSPKRFNSKKSQLKTRQMTIIEDAFQSLDPKIINMNLGIRKASQFSNSQERISKFVRKKTRNIFLNANLRMSVAKTKTKLKKDQNIFKEKISNIIKR